MVALCGASLAAMSRLYRQYDAAYADKCLEKARLAWEFIGNMSEVDPYALASIEYIMGSNSENYSFITGFGENGPKYPHYRNIFLDDSNDMDAVEIDAKHSQLGYLVGGSFNPATYPDNINNYKSGEGGIDYNAGLVGALGYINSILAPVAADTLGSVKSAANDIQCYLYPNPTVDVVMLNSSQTGKAVVSLYNVEGQKVMAAETTWEELAKGFNVMMLVKGVYTLTVESANGKATKQFIKK